MKFDFGELSFDGSEGICHDAILIDRSRGVDFRVSVVNRANADFQLDSKTSSASFNLLRPHTPRRMNSINLARAREAATRLVESFPHRAKARTSETSDSNQGTSLPLPVSLHMENHLGVQRFAKGFKKRRNQFDIVPLAPALYYFRLEALSFAVFGD
jgi:hypothetical protein